MNNAFSRFIILLAVFASIFFAPKIVDAATYYVSPSGSNNNSGTSQTQPFATFSKAFSVMQGGDTLYVMDGVYNQQISDMPSGSAGNYTKIYALNNHKAEIDGQGTLPSSGWEALLYINGKSYVEVRGLRVHSSSATNHVCGIESSNNIIMRVTGCWHAGTYKHDHPISIGGGNNVLLEDVWAFGRGRYSILMYETNNITLRRVVTRWDSGAYASEPVAGFSVYNTSNSLLENTITMDHNHQLAISDHNGYYVPVNINPSNNNRFYGAIALNLPMEISGTQYGAGGFNIDPTSGRVADGNSLKDCVAWQTNGGLSLTGPTTNATVSNCTMGDSYSSGFWNGSSVTGTSAKNLLSYNNDSYGFRNNGGSMTLSYSGAFGNSSEAYSGVSCATGCRTDNPNLKYITRVENDSSYKGVGEGGADIGANIVYRYVDGALTSQNLWPWPYEDWIKEDMCNSSFLQEVGRTGSDAPKWCTTNKTLTQYIWEYLGNTCPTEICSGGGGDTQAPSIPTGLSAQANSSSQINLSWTASTDNVAVTGYRIYRCTGSSCTPSTQIATSSTNSYSNTGLSASTAYTYSVSAYDAAGNASSQSGSASATTSSGGDTQAPSVPTGLSVQAISSNQINLSWTASTDNVGVTGYRIYRCLGSNCTPTTQIATSSTNSYSNTGLSASTTYTYRVSAYDAAGNVSSQSSSASATTSSGGGGGDTQAPTVPNGLTGQGVSSNQINLSWTASTDNVGVSGYNIYRDGALIDTSATNSYSDSGLSASTAYTYTISAYDAAGNASSQSSSASATTSSGGDSVGGGSGSGNQNTGSGEGAQQTTAQGATEISGGGCGYIDVSGGKGNGSGGNASQALSFILMLLIILTGIALARRFSYKSSYNL